MIDKEYLRNHAEHRKELQDELQRYELNHGDNLYGKSPSNIDGMPHATGCNSNGVYDKVIKYMDEDTYIGHLQQLVNEEQKEIETVLSLLQRANQKSVIRYKYYQCMEWDDVAYYMYGGRRDYCDKADYYKQKAQKVHGTALSNMMRFQNEQ